MDARDVPPLLDWRDDWRDFLFVRVDRRRVPAIHGDRQF